MHCWALPFDVRVQQQEAVEEEPLMHCWALPFDVKVQQQEAVEEEDQQATVVTVGACA